MKIKIFLLMMISLFFSLNISNATEMTDENLIQKFPLPDIGGPWKSYSKVEEDSTQAMWKNKGGEEILMTLVIYHDGGESVEGIKRAEEGNYKDSCVDYSSNTINETVENGYKSITWKIICKTKSNFAATVLHKGITGNDAIYVIQKIWKTDVSSRSEEAWSRYLNEIYVCDSRLEKSPCPAGFSEVTEEDEF
ncbi:hypothetical protein MNBD_GAMMA21-1179 [hydrothermal vent metagenome]|uniref:Uncharacterized protein n=1 Tax=hydrothermal vent metagenome TaxID=652676 RepID=A0A3B0ZX46_9ZZZZ